MAAAAAETETAEVDRRGLRLGFMVLRVKGFGIWGKRG